MSKYDDVVQDLTDVFLPDTATLGSAEHYDAVLWYLEQLEREATVCLPSEDDGLLSDELRNSFLVSLASIRLALESGAKSKTEAHAAEKSAKAWLSMIEALLSQLSTASEVATLNAQQVAQLDVSTWREVELAAVKKVAAASIVVLVLPINPFSANRILVPGGRKSRTYQQWSSLILEILPDDFLPDDMSDKSLWFELGVSRMFKVENALKCLLDAFRAKYDIDRKCSTPVAIHKVVVDLAAGQRQYVKIAVVPQLALEETFWLQTGCFGNRASSSHREVQHQELIPTLNDLAYTAHGKTE